LLGLGNFMRLSLMKAAHVDVGGASCRKSGYMGRKRILQTLFTPRATILAFGRSLFALVAVAAEGATPHLFRPMYAGANMHPSREEDFVVDFNRNAADGLVSA
jgi:hypothetical protein